MPLGTGRVRPGGQARRVRYRLTPQEQAFIAAIGFLRVPGLFAPDVAAFGSRPGRRLFTMNFRQGLDLVSGR